MGANSARPLLSLRSRCCVVVGDDAAAPTIALNTIEPRVTDIAGMSHEPPRAPRILPIGSPREAAETFVDLDIDVLGF